MTWIRKLKNKLYNLSFIKNFCNKIEVHWITDNDINQRFCDKKLFNLGIVENKYPRKWLKNNGYKLIKLESKINNNEIVRLKRGEKVMSVVEHINAVCEELGHLYLIDACDLFKNNYKTCIYHVLNTLDYIFEENNIDRLLNAFIVQTKEDENNRVFKFYIINRGFEKESYEKVKEIEPKAKIYPMDDQFLKIKLDMN